VTRAKRSLGQNFLIDVGFQRRIVAALDLHPEDEVVEIGPGTGALTKHIAENGCTLIAVELDDDLSDALQRQFAASGNLRVIHGDALDMDFATIGEKLPEQRKIVGNIPYNITTPLLFHLLERNARPERIIVMVQREVADRILAAPGEKVYGALSVGVRSVAKARRLFNVPRGAFRPAPDVDSTVLEIRPLRPFPLSAAEESDLRELTRAAFAWRRKQFQKILRGAQMYGLTAEQVAHIADRTQSDLEHRPETFSPEQFITLARALRVAGFPHAAG
jgi:16S rRNA (adenine1518-N6/adenine1519-N6)-dimethyltransferase